MLVINFRECCKRCPHRDTYVDEDRANADAEVIDVFTMIGCEHEQVCKTYNETSEIASEITKLLDKYKPVLVPQTKGEEVEYNKPKYKMLPKELSKQLRFIAEKYKNQLLRVGDMAEDAADAIDSLQVFVDTIGKLSTCNGCVNKDCRIRPGLGQTVRYNCAYYKCDFNREALEKFYEEFSEKSKEGEVECSTNATSVKD